MPSICSYNFCGDGAMNGNATAACFYNMPVAQKIGSEVRYSTSPDLSNYNTSIDANTYPTEVSGMGLRPQGISACLTQHCS